MKFSIEISAWTKTSCVFPSPRFGELPGLEEGCHEREGRMAANDSAKPRKVMNHFYDSLTAILPRSEEEEGRLSVNPL